DRQRASGQHPVGGVQFGQRKRRFVGQPLDSRYAPGGGYVRGHDDPAAAVEVFADPVRQLVGGHAVHARAVVGDPFVEQCDDVLVTAFAVVVAHGLGRGRARNAPDPAQNLLTSASHDCASTTPGTTP